MELSNLLDIMKKQSSAFENMVNVEVLQFFYTKACYRFGKDVGPLSW